MPDPVLEDRSISFLRARPLDHGGGVTEAADSAQPDCPAGGSERVPRRADDRRHQQGRAEVDHGRRSERTDLLGAARLLRIRADHADDHELQAGERGGRRPDDDVEAFPGGERRYPFHRCPSFEPRVPSLGSTAASSSRPEEGERTAATFARRTLKLTRLRASLRPWLRAARRASSTDRRTRFRGGARGRRLRGWPRRPWRRPPSPVRGRGRTGN